MLCLFLKISATALNKKTPRRNSNKSRRPANKGRYSRRNSGKIRTYEPAETQDNENPEGIRLNRYIAQAGVCSRRKADDLILEGRVKLNDSVVKELGTRVTNKDVVEVNGRRITPLSYEYILVNKPSNIITTNSDEKGRKIILDLIDNSKVQQKGLFPVGRLDRNTVGVILVTNDGELAHRLMHPSYEVEKLYKVRTKESVDKNHMEKMVKGLDIDGETYVADKVEYLKPTKYNELGIRLHEGKNRHIRRMLEALNYTVTYLERVNYAGLTSEGVRRGHWRRLKPVEIKRLRRLVKLK